MQDGSFLNLSQVHIYSNFKRKDKYYLIEKGDSQQANWNLGEL